MLLLLLVLFAVVAVVVAAAFAVVGVVVGVAGVASALCKSGGLCCRFRPGVIVRCKMYWVLLMLLLLLFGLL